MKTKELKIGNLITSHVRLEGSQIERMRFNSDILIVTKETFGMPDDFMKLLKPIPLTEEWLVKFGFEFDTNLWHNQIALYPCSDGFNYNVNFFEHDCLHTIEYVHQLQNLYLALTGGELQIKL